MSKDDMMELAVDNGYKVRIKCTNGITYIGVADSYVSADDEDDGAPSIIIVTDNGSYFGFGGNDIVSIEFLDNESEEDEDGKA